jgi:hypothetical protein
VGSQRPLGTCTANFAWGLGQRMRTASMRNKIMCPAATLMVNGRNGVEDVGQPRVASIVIGGGAPGTPGGRKMSCKFRSSVAAALGILSLQAFASPSQAVPFSAGDFLTYTQNDWGNTATAEQLLTANYNTLYAPFGVFQVGITNGLGFSITFSDAADLLVFLPAAGPPGALNSNLLNPTTSSSGLFGGEVAALRLNVDFSDAGLISHLPGVPFGDLELTGFSGSLTGLNDQLVRNFLGIINIALGGGATPYTIPDLDEVALQLDGSFFDGIPLQWAQDHLAVSAATSAPVSEPSTLALFGFGLLGLAGMRVLRSKPV